MGSIAWILTFMAVWLTASAETTSGPVTGQLGNATVVKNNPVGKMYMATLPTTEFFNPDNPRGNIKGSIIATAHPNGTGVDFQISFSNLPTSGGPFPYHIHTSSVPANGNCTETLGHLDPFERGEDPPCDSTLPQTCQVGDLSGKYGKITSDPFTAAYTDLYASTLSGLGSFFGNRSFVIHFANTTRISCANFVPLGDTSVPTTNNNTIQLNSAASSINIFSMLAVLVVVIVVFMI
ncbi:hypothetical protein B7463_g7556, partial [Scytalidium lignicola]